MERIPPIRELAVAIQPDPKKEKVWYAKYVIRKVSIVITWVLLHTPFTANMATFSQTALSIAGAVLLAFGGYKWALLALFLIQLGYTFDCIDGEIARFRKVASINGVFMDSVNHAVVIPMLFFSLSFFSYYLVNQIWVLFIGGVLAVISANPVKKGMLSALYYLMGKKDSEKYQYGNLIKEVAKEDQSLPLNDIPGIPKKRTYGKIFFAVLKDISEYPTSMNIITLSVIADLLINNYTSWNIYPISLYLLVAYTGLLFAKEVYFFAQVYLQRSVEKKFLDFIK